MENNLHLDISRMSGKRGNKDQYDAYKNIWEIVEDAYVYAFPLVLMDALETWTAPVVTSMDTKG